MQGIVDIGHFRVITCVLNISNYERYIVAKIRLFSALE